LVAKHADEIKNEKINSGKVGHWCLFSIQYLVRFSYLLF
jgi:hypothetical protein